MTDEQLRRWALSWGVFLPPNVCENLAVELVKLAQIIRDDTAEHARNAALDEAACKADGEYHNAVLATQGFGEWARCAENIARQIRALKDKP